MIVHTAHGLLIEHVDHPDGGEAAYVVDQARPGHDLSAPVIAIEGGVAYEVVIEADGTESIVAIARPGRGARVIALTADAPMRMAGNVVEVADRLLRAELGRDARLLDVAPDAFAVNGGALWFALGAQLRVVDGSRPPVALTDAPIAALNVTDSAAYWLDGAALWRMPLGSAPAIVWKSDTPGPIQHADAAFAVLDDGTIVTTTAGFTVGDLIAIAPDGSTRVIVPMGDAAFGAKVVASGRRVYYSVGGTQVWAADLDAAPSRLLDGHDVIDLAANGGHAYAAVMLDGVAHVFTLDRAPVDLGAAPGLVAGTLVARPDGVAWASGDAHAILMFAVEARSP